jgi:glycosyltransferase involved in cell wall biosynthesis
MISSRRADDITVVVPAYNQGPYIERTIQSLLQQSVAPAEIIVSNNHSTDETSAVLTRYASRIRLVSPPKFLPAGEHGDFVMSLVKTAWCALLSSDDVARPNYIETFAQSAAEHPNASVIHGGVLYVDSDDKEVVPHIAMKQPFFGNFPENLVSQFRGPTVHFAAFALRVDAFRKTKGFSPWLGMGDWPVFLELSQYGPFIYHKKLLANYRVNHRIDIHKNRFLAMLHDECKIATELIPHILADTQHHAFERTHKRISLIRYRTRLLELHSYREYQQKDEAVAWLKKWAMYLNVEFKTDWPQPSLKLRFWKVVNKSIYEVKHIIRIIYAKFKFRGDT